jgi:PAS domain S-box-containing protein
VNLTGASLLGIERSRLIGRRFGLYVATESSPIFSEFLGNVFTSQGKEAYEVKLLKEGKYPLFVRIEAGVAASGEECRVALIDITRRKRSDEVPHESDERFRTLANAPVIVWDSSFKVMRFNHAFERLTELKSEEVINKPLDILFPDNSRDESMRLINNALSGERWETVEIPILHTDGSIRTVLWNSANIHDRDIQKSSRPLLRARISPNAKMSRRRTKI